MKLFLLLTLLTTIPNPFTTATNFFPKWPPTYQMNLSTIVQPCNYSGYFTPQIVSQKLSKFGIVSIDWSNAKMLWSNTSPMNCQARLLDQALAIKAANPKTRVFVYRNLVKALPWFGDVRVKLEDDKYNPHWFLRFKPNGPYHMNPCTGNKCSMMYHDQLQTPHHPAQCKGECDCGTGLPCGEYLWDHRNVSLRTWLADVYVLGPKNGTGINNDAISGVFLDDGWSNKQDHIAPWMPKTGFCDTYNKYGGPTEEDYKCIEDMNLSQSDVNDIYTGWRQTLDIAHSKIISAGGFAWQLFHTIGGSPNKTECASWVRKQTNAGNTTLMYQYTTTFNMSQSDFEIDLAMFLLIRGKYGWLGYGWNGCHSSWEYQWFDMLDRDYGEPQGMMKEVKDGVFERKWSKCVVTMDCNAYKPSFVFA